MKSKINSRVLLETNLDALLKKPTPQDIIAAIFAYSGLKRFTNDRRQIQGFIFSMKFNIKEASNLLEPFVFSDGVDVYPYSRLLESVLAGLFLGGVIFTWSPKEDGYNMEEGIRKKVIKDTKERFFPEQIPILKKLGEKWREFNRRQA